MALWEHFHLPQSVEEAIELLNRYDGRACVVGGGTDLILEMQQGGRSPVEALVDRSYPRPRPGSNRSILLPQALAKAAERACSTGLMPWPVLMEWVHSISVVGTPFAGVQGRPATSVELGCADLA